MMIAKANCAMLKACESSQLGTYAEHCCPDSFCCDQLVFC